MACLRRPTTMLRANPNYVTVSRNCFALLDNQRTNTFEETSNAFFLSVLETRHVEGERSEFAARVVYTGWLA